MSATTGRVFIAHTASLNVDSKATWTYAANHRDVIAAHWQMALAANPNFFNGTIHVLLHMQVEDGHFAATLAPTEFKNFLYWRDEGFPQEARVRDAFGSALIRSREGYIILGRQRPGNINEGQAYLPGGFIDHRDVRADGTVDLRASVAREVAEETGLGPGELSAGEGFIVTDVHPHVSFAVPYTSHLPASELVARIKAHIAGEAEPELAEPVVLRSPADMEGRSITHYARALLASPLPWVVSRVER